jgi:cytochrome c-type biogenesis protein CcmF
VLLFLMAIAPVLPWRKASTEVLSVRLFWPAVAAICSMALALVLGGRGLYPVMTFGLGGFAAGAAVRQVALATRRQGWRGLVGRTNGGMIVHLGVILVAVALVSSNAYTSSTDLRLEQGVPTEWNGHSFELVDVVAETDARADVIRAHVLVDGETFGPAITTYLRMGQAIGTPSVRTGLTHDVYLTIAGTQAPQPGATEVRLEVFYKPLVLWLWIGGLLMAIGTVLAAFPGRRRRNPIDPVSSPVPSGDVRADQPVAVDRARTAQPDDEPGEHRETADV